MAIQIDFALAVERLVPQAAFGTARATDIDQDDYAALERTWYDARPIPSRGQLQAAWAQHQAEQQANVNARLDRQNAMLLLRANDQQLPTTGEIGSITSLADVKPILLRLRHKLRLFEAYFAILIQDEGSID